MLDVVEMSRRMMYAVSKTFRRRSKFKINVLINKYMFGTVSSIIKMLLCLPGVVGTSSVGNKRVFKTFGKRFQNTFNLRIQHNFQNVKQTF